MVYLLMALLGLGGFGYALARGNDKAGLLSTYLVAWGLAAVAEWWAFGIFTLYRYRPGLSSDWRWDSAWGVVLAEAIFLPALNTVLAAFTNLWVGAAVGTAIVTVTEFTFVRLGLFTYQGWQLWVTVVTFPLFFLATGLYWPQVRRRGLTDPTLQAITRFSALVIVVTITSLFMWASGVTETDVRLLPTAAGNRSLMRYVVHGVGILLGYWALLPKDWADRWGRIALTVAGMIVVNDAFEGLGLLMFLRPFSGVLDAAVIGVLTILVGVITDWIFRLAEVSRGRRVPAWEPPDV